MRDGKNFNGKDEQDVLIIKGEKADTTGKRVISLETSDEFISVWVGNQKSTAKGISMEINLYVYNRCDGSIWIGGLMDPEKIIESKILFPSSVEYLCAMNSMRCFMGDLFLMRPNDMRVLEIMDMVAGRTSSSSVENYLKVLYKMMVND